MNTYKILFSILVSLQFAEQDCFSMGENLNNFENSQKKINNADKKKEKDKVNKKRTREEFCEQDQELAKCFNSPNKKQKSTVNDVTSFFNSFNQSGIPANSVINDSTVDTDNNKLLSLKEMFPSIADFMVNESSFPFLNHLETENNNMINDSTAHTNNHMLPSLREVFPPAPNFIVNESSFPFLNHLETENNNMVNNSILNTTNELLLQPGQETSTNNFFSENFYNTDKSVNNLSLLPGMEVLIRPDGFLYYKFQDMLDDKTVDKDQLFNLLTEEIKKICCILANNKIEKYYLNSCIKYFEFIINEGEKRLTQENFYRLIEQKVYSIHGPGKSLFRRLNSMPLAKSELFHFLYSKYTSNDAFVDHILCNKDLDLFNEGAQHGKLLLPSLHKLLKDQIQQKKISTDNQNKIIEIMQSITKFDNDSKKNQLKQNLILLRRYKAPRNVLISSSNIAPLWNSSILPENDNNGFNCREDLCSSLSSFNDCNTALQTCATLDLSNYLKQTKKTQPSQFAIHQVREVIFNKFKILIDRCYTLLSKNEFYTLIEQQEEFFNEIYNAKNGTVFLDYIINKYEYRAFIDRVLFGKLNLLQKGYFLSNDFLSYNIKKHCCAFLKKFSSLVTTDDLERIKRTLNKIKDTGTTRKKRMELLSKFISQLEDETSFKKFF